MIPLTQSAAERYDYALRRARDSRLPPGYPRPHLTADWPPDNLAVLEHYRQWLAGGGASQQVINILYVPMAGHVLGLALKPATQLDLDHDLQRAFEYIQAKHLSAEWTDMCRNALAKFRQFLQQQRGQVTIDLPPVDHTRYVTGLPDWLVEQLERYQHLRQAQWRPARTDQRSLRFGMLTLPSGVGCVSAIGSPACSR